MSPGTIISREIRFASRPEGAPSLTTFALAMTEVPPPPAGQGRDAHVGLERIDVAGDKQTDPHIIAPKLGHWS